MFTRVKTDAEISSMREGGHMLAAVLDLLSREMSAGMTTQDLADLARRELKSLGGQPAFLGYQGFPDVLCVSVNEEVVHGIPKANRIINNGDVVSIDFGVKYNGLITDAARTIVVNYTNELKIQEMVKQTEIAMLAGINVVKNGVKVGDISAAIEAVMRTNNLGIVRELVGHGVGDHLHEDPNIPNYGPAGSGRVLLSGMTIAIEPMATLGSHQVFIDNDGWTVKTKDGSCAAHFENTVVITDYGAEILTSV